MDQLKPTEASDDPLSKWVHWVDRAIEAAQERGDFDDLPGHGKPLMIDEHPYAGDRALGFHVLSNAGIKPLWMELDREIQHRRATLFAMLDRVDQGLATEEPYPTPPRTARLRWFRLPAIRGPGSAQHSQTRLTNDALMTRERGRFLRLASELDETIRRYNHALPRELRHLERVRLSEDDAAKTFDEASGRAR